RAFMLAGCQNIISSLWKAEDRATAYITAEFYKYLENGNSYSESLRKAKLALLSDPQMAQYQHPVFWSHLVLVGDIPKSASLTRYYFFLFSFLILLIGFALVHFWRKFSSNSK
ncbi:MAG: CHAT domain-containing protein, partial [Cyclobacteriaceae bacterium]|nr:CHAT domain-containing protein [Cyclobacteriaceae bacterium]